MCGTGGLLYPTTELTWALILAVTKRITMEDAAVRRGVKGALRTVGMDVRECDSGEKAVDQASDAAVELVLLDVGLPGKDGFDVLNDLRKSRPRLPVIMLTAPAPSSEIALRKAGMTWDDIDLFEVNEAFAAVVLKFIKESGVDPEKINVNGGSIALGHPLGATGGMLIGTALDELERRDLNTALVTMCIGGGMGIATILERV